MSIHILLIVFYTFTHRHTHTHTVCAVWKWCVFHFIILVYECIRTNDEWNWKRHRLAFGKKQNKKNTHEKKMKSYSMQSIIFVNIGRNSNCVTHSATIRMHIYDVYLHCCSVICLCISVCCAMQWIFNICHCIHAFVLIALQSTISILRSNRVIILHLCIMHHCILSWMRKYIYMILSAAAAAFFHSVSFGINQCQFFNDYFHFNFHIARSFFACSLYGSMNPWIYCFQSGNVTRIMLILS